MLYQLKVRLFYIWVMEASNKPKYVKCIKNELYKKHEKIKAPWLGNITINVEMVLCYIHSINTSKPTSLDVGLLVNIKNYNYNRGEFSVRKYTINVTCNNKNYY